MQAHPPPSLGLDIGSFIASEVADALPKRKVIQPTMHGCLGNEDIYVGQGHHTHRPPTSKWATPFLEGQHGTKEECLIQYGAHLTKSGLIAEVWELRNHNRPYSVPCVADMLIAAVYGEWQEKSRNPCDEKPKGQAPNTAKRGWAGKALSALVATSGDIGKAAGQAMAQLLRHPPLTLSEELRWPQVSAFQAFEGY